MSIPYFAWIPPLLAALALAGLWMSEPAPPDLDLQVTAPTVAGPGQQIGLRAWVFDSADGPVPDLVEANITAELENKMSQRRVRVPLAVSAVTGSEGSVRVPGQDGHIVSLSVIAVVEDETLRVDREIQVRTDPPPLPKVVQVDADFGEQKDDPSVFGARVDGGACVPELVCNILIRFPDRVQRARVAADVGLAFAADQTAFEVRRPTEGVLRVQGRVRGNEAAIRITPLGSTTAVSQRIALPIVSGGIRVRATVDEGRVVFEHAAVEGPIPVAVDIFRDGQWIAATSVGPAGGTLTSEPPVGSFIAQARRDVFTTQPVGVAHVRSRQAVDALTEYRSAVDAQSAFVLPRASSSRRQRIDSGDTSQRDRSLWAAGFIALLGVVASAILFRLELAARVRDRAFAAEAEALGAPLSPKALRRYAFWVLGIFVFASIAVIALSRRWV